MEREPVNINLTRTLVPLKNMSKNHLATLLADVQVDMLCAGETLFTAAHYDHQQVYLLHGKVELVAASGEREIVCGDSSVLPLSPWQPRQQTAVALTDCSVLRLDSERLDKLLTWSEAADYLQVLISLSRDLDDDIDWIMSLLRSNLFFKVSPLYIEQIFTRLQPQRVSAGEVVIQQGDSGDHCFFIRDGEAQVLRTENGEQRLLAEVGVGRCIGEDALMNETLRNASVVMLTDGLLMRLSKHDFYPLLREPSVPEFELVQLRSSRDQVVMVDVRSEEEYARKHIAEAVNIPLTLLGIKSRLLRTDVRYVFYCDTGRRSRAAAYLLGQQGYDACVLANSATLFGQPEWQDLLEEQGNYVLREGLAVVGQ